MTRAQQMRHRLLTTLKIDVDPGHEPYTLDHLVRVLARAGKRVRVVEQSRSRSMQGWHLLVRITPPCDTEMEVVALQAVCGSDVYRESNNVQRVRTLRRMTPTQRRYWRDRWNVLYDPTY